MKSGIKTSEFWATTLMVIGSAAAAYINAVPAKWGVALSTLATMAYTISRGLAKQPINNSQPTK